MPGPSFAPTSLFGPLPFPADGGGPSALGAHSATLHDDQLREPMDALHTTNVPSTHATSPLAVVTAIPGTATLPPPQQWVDLEPYPQPVQGTPLAASQHMVSQPESAMKGSQPYRSDSPNQPIWLCTPPSPTPGADARQLPALPSASFAPLPPSWPSPAHPPLQPANSIELLSSAEQQQSPSFDRLPVFVPKRAAPTSSAAAQTAALQPHAAGSPGVSGTTGTAGQADLGSWAPLTGRSGFGSPAAGPALVQGAPAPVQGSSTSPQGAPLPVQGRTAQAGWWAGSGAMRSGLAAYSRSLGYPPGCGLHNLGPDHASSPSPPPPVPRPPGPVPSPTLGLSMCGTDAGWVVLRPKLPPPVAAQLLSTWAKLGLHAVISQVRGSVFAKYTPPYNVPIIS